MKTDREYSLPLTDDLIRFWRSKVEGQGHTLVQVWVAKASTSTLELLVILYCIPVTVNFDLKCIAWQCRSFAARLVKLTLVRLHCWCLAGWSGLSVIRPHTCRRPMIDVCGCYDNDCHPVVKPRSRSTASHCHCEAPRDDMHGLEPISLSLFGFCEQDVLLNCEWIMTKQCKNNLQFVHVLTATRSE